MQSLAGPHGHRGSLHLSSRHVQDISPQQTETHSSSAHKLAIHVNQAQQHHPHNAIPLFVLPLFPGTVLHLQGRDGGQWPGFFWGFIIGLQLSLSSYVFGQHVALFFSSFIEKDASPDRPGTANPAAEIPQEDIEMEDAGSCPGFV